MHRVDPSCNRWKLYRPINEHDFEQEQLDQELVVLWTANSHAYPHGCLRNGRKARQLFLNTESGTDAEKYYVPLPDANIPDDVVVRANLWLREDCLVARLRLQHPLLHLHRPHRVLSMPQTVQVGAGRPCRRDSWRNLSSDGQKC